MSIDAVIFDFGGVLCFPPNADQWNEAAAFCGVPAPRFQEAFWRFRDEYDSGGDPTDYWTRVGWELGKRFDDTTIGAMIEREIAFWSYFDVRVLRWAKRLRQHGIRTGILSNLPRPLGTRLRAIPGFLDHFDQVTFSFELNVIKPNPLIYMHAIEGLAMPAQGALFLDDRDDNVEGARATGLNAELFASWEQFLATGPAEYELPTPEL